ncbi:hypothetical protein BGZ61DRAFT_474270 [Ilyonectria robusta]|uniref:uncharacterized protein n=1 Tax=Ilyonectria robusta TaxID=1079257 RepID=UPI001E8DC948|nr:uncharacterized protein BGZ61DRAFT_474270 [Ilyonectria robusta]KAH8733605.1 hypothetical protein BGZ61DRAFT_474270 [Ilyonectria robusta]
MASDASSPAAANEPPESPDPLRKLTELLVMDAVGLQSFDNNDLGQAEIVQRGVLEETKEFFDHDHPLATEIMHNLSITLFDLKQYVEAIELQREVLKRQETILGPYHPGTLLAKDSLSVTLGAVDELDECFSLVDDICRVKQDYSALDKILQHLASSSWYAPHNTDATLKLQRALFTVRQRILGIGHPQTLQAMGTLILTLAHRGDLKEAISQQRKMLNSQQAADAPDAFDELAPAEVLAFLLRLDGRLADVLSLRRKLAEECKDRNGSEHIATLIALSKVGDALRECGLLDDAMSTYNTVWETSNRCNGEQDPETINAIEKLALTLHYQRKPDEAISHQQKVVALRCESVWLNNHRTVTSGETLAFWQFERGQFDDAVSSFHASARTISHGTDEQSTNTETQDTLS